MALKLPRCLNSLVSLQANVKRAFGALERKQTLRTVKVDHLRGIYIYTYCIKLQCKLASNASHRTVYLTAGCDRRHS